MIILVMHLSRVDLNLLVVFDAVRASAYPPALRDRR